MAGKILDTRSVIDWSLHSASDSVQGVAAPSRSESYHHDFEGGPITKEFPQRTFWISFAAHQRHDCRLQFGICEAVRRATVIGGRRGGQRRGHQVRRAPFV
eukprot:2385436-Pleurochrysis_carterae.AAC.6